eukprot:jgi/Chlat1/8261/Chrsp78S00626
MEPSVEPDMPANAEGLVKQIWETYAHVWDYSMEADPFSATIIGDYRFNDSLGDLSKEKHDAIQKFFTDTLAKIPEDECPPSELQNLLYLKDMLRLKLKALIILEAYETPAMQLFGPHLMLPQLPSFHPFHNEKDCQDFIKRLKAFSKLADQIIEAFRAGITNKRTQPPPTVEALVGQCRAQLCPANESPIYTAAAPKFEKLNVPAEEILEVIDTEVKPAYEKLANFLETEYAPHARDTAGIIGWEHGREIYADAVQYYTSLPLTAAEVHEKGLKEVARIRDDMEGIKSKLNFDGTLKEFMEATKADPQHAPKSPDEILQGYRDILEISKSKLKDYFGVLPKSDFEIRAVEPFREKNSPPAHYYPPPEDRSRPGIFYASTYKYETRVKYVMESIALHEAVPGHHLQIAVAQELPNLPRARKQVQEFCTGYVEGWGLYTERFGIEMGFYQDPYQDFGRLVTEMMRAVRLVVDTGLHDLGWTRDEALEYFSANCAMGEADVIAEIDRYMVLPGQALSYKIGELKLWELRHRAEQQLKDRFDIKAFHDLILGSGALPLTSLEKLVDQWLASQAA